MFYSQQVKKCHQRQPQVFSLNFQLFDQKYESFQPHIGIGAFILSVGGLTLIGSSIWLYKSHNEAQYYYSLMKRLTVMSQPNRFETRVVKGKCSFVLLF